MGRKVRANSHGVGEGTGDERADSEWIEMRTERGKDGNGTHISMPGMEMWRGY